MVNEFLPESCINMTAKKIGTPANIFEIIYVSIFFVARYFGKSEESCYLEKFGKKLRFNFGLKSSREG